MSIGKNVEQLDDSSNYDSSVADSDEDAKFTSEWEKLDDLRKQWEDDPTLRHGDFVVNVRGGDAADAIQFCKDMGIPQTFRSEISLYDGAANAAALSRTWCHRMQFFFNLSKTLPHGTLAFTQEQKDTWTAPADFVALRTYFESMSHRAGINKCARIIALFA